VRRFPDHGEAWPQAQLALTIADFAPTRKWQSAPRRAPRAGQTQDTLHVDRPDAGQTANPAQGLADGHPGHRRGCGGQSRGVEEQTFAVVATDLAQKGVGLPAQMGRLLRQEACGAGEPGAKGGVEAGFQVRQELVADAVAEVPEVVVARVVPPLEATIAEVGEHLLPRDLEEGAEETAGPRSHSAEPRGPRSPKQTHEQGFRLVVTGVGHRDGGRARFVANAAEEAVALPAGRLLQPSSLAADPGEDVGLRGVEGNVEPSAQTATEAGVLRRVRAELVVQVGGDHPEPVPGSQGDEGIQEGHGIGPAGESKDDPLPVDEGSGGPQGAIDGRKQPG
jgi:hypothetical protein